MSLFEPLAGDPRYETHLAAVVEYVAREAKYGDLTRELNEARQLAERAKFDGTYPMPAGGRAAGYKAPPPPGGRGGES